MKQRPVRVTPCGSCPAYSHPSDRRSLHFLFLAIFSLLFILLAARSVSAGTMHIQNGASLTGYDGASINGTTRVESGGTMVANSGPGCFTHADLALESGSTLKVEIGGTTPCSEHDRVNVGSGVTLTGAALDLSAYNGFVPSALDRFIIVDNGGGAAVSGTFAGLAEGSEISLSGVALTVSYQSGDGNDVTLTARSSQAITFNTLSGKTYGDADFSLTASASSGLSVGFSSQTPSVCSVSGSTVSILAAGPCIIRAGQAGNSYYYAAPDVERSFPVSVKALSVTGLTAQDKTYDGTTDATLLGSPVLNGVVPGDDVGLSGTAEGAFSDAGAAVDKIVTVTGLSLTGADAGNYSLASSFTTTATIVMADQTITFAALPDRIYGDPDFSISATSDSGLSVSFTSTTPGICTVSGATVSLIAVGTCTITASQAGDSNYNAAADVSWSFNVLATISPSAGANGSITPNAPQTVKYNQTLNFTVTPDTGYHVDIPVGGTCGGSYIGDPYDNLNGISYTTNAVTGNCSVAATFSINTYTVSANVGDGGILDAGTPSPKTLYHGDTATFTFIADTGFHVESVTGCGLNYMNGNNAVSTYTATIDPVTDDCQVIAAFAKNGYLLAVTVDDKGAVTSDSGGIDCPGTCSAQYDYNTVVVLTATSVANGKFIGWSGDPDCDDGVVTMTSDISCSAEFYKSPWTVFIPAIISNGGP